MSDGNLVVRSKDDLVQFVNRNPMKRKSVLLIWLALGGVFVEAYDFVSLGIGTEQLTEQFQLSSFQVGTLTAIMAIGGFFGAIFGGYLTDKFGRAFIFLVDLLLLVLATVGAALAHNYAVLLIFRCLMGIGVGIETPVAFSFIAELSNIKQKGKYLNLWQPVWYMATVSSGVIGLMVYLLHAEEYLWRWAVGLGAVFALAVFFLRIAYMKESPLWAANNLPIKEAIKIVEKTYNITIVNKSLDTDQKSDNKPSSFKLLFHKRYRARSFLAWIISITQTMQYYSLGFYIPIISGYIFGQGMINSIYGTIIFNLFGILGGFFGAYLTVRMGTRKLAIYGFAVVAASLIYIGLIYGHSNILLSALPIATFIFAHSAGPGPQGKTIAAASYPTSLRALGTGASEAANKVGSMFGLFFFPMVLAAVGLAKTMLILTLVPIAGLIATSLIKWESVGKDVENDVIEEGKDTLNGMQV